MAHDDRFFTLVCCTALIITGIVFLWTHNGFIRFGLGPAADAMLDIDQASDTPSSPQTSNRPDPKPVLAGAPCDTPAAVPAIFVAQVEKNTTQSEFAGPVVRSPDHLLGIVEAIVQEKSPRIADWDLPALTEVLVRKDHSGRLVVAPGTHRRYKRAREVITNLDGPTVAAACDVMEHSLALGLPGEDLFRTKVVEALDLLLAPELPDVELDMVSRGTHWGFADRGFDDLAPAQKHMLLMGIDNQRAIRATLEEIRRYLGGPPAMVVPGDPSSERSVVMAAHNDRSPIQDQVQVTAP